MQRMKITKVDIVAVATIVVSFVVSFLFINRQLKDYSYFKEQEHKIAEELTMHKDTRRGIEGIEREIESIRSRLNEFDQRLPKRKEIDTFLRQIWQVAGETGIGINVIQPRGMGEEELYSTLPVHIEAEGRFPDFYRFIYKLDRIPRLSTINSMSIDGDSKGLCRIKLDLSIFISKEKGSFKEWLLK